MANWIGDSLTGLKEDFPQEIRLDYYGVAGGALYFNTLYTGALDLVYNIRVHPVYTYLKRVRGVIKREEADLAKVIIDFEGVPLTTDSYDYKLSGSTSSEPIETHPDFDILIGGRPGYRYNNSVFDSKSRAFKGFAAFAKLENTTGTAIVATKPPADGKGGYTIADDNAYFGPAANETNEEGDGYILNPKAGVKSYLSANLIYEETRVLGNYITINASALGKIDSPPSSPFLPTVGGARTWLLISLDATPVGFGSKIIKRWRLSGFRGWDTDIYHS